MVQSRENIEQLGIWPLKITLLNATGYTLWANRSNEPTDLLLAVDQNMFLFKTIRSLYKFVSSDITLNLSELAGFRELSTILKGSKADNTLYAPYNSFNFDSIVKILLDENWADWSTKVRSKVLDHLNLIWDIGSIIQNDWVVKQMEGRQELLGSFADILLLGGSVEHDEIEKSSEEIIRLYKRCLFEIETKIFLISK